MSVVPVVSEDKASGPIVAKVSDFFGKVFLFKKSEQKSKIDRLKHVLIKSISISFWSYSLVTIFFINLDQILRRAVGSPFDRIIDFKLIAVLSVVALLWLIVGSRDFFFSLLYISVYPLKIMAEMVLILGLLILKFRSWIVFFALMNAIVDLVRSFKVSFITVTVFIVCTTVIMTAGPSFALLVSITLMIVLVLFSYVRGTWKALAPSSLFKVLRSFPKRTGESPYKTFELEDELRGKSLIEMSDEQVTKWNNKLQTSVLYNRGMLFYAKTLRDYQRSRLPFLPSLFTVFRLLAFTVIGFSLVNYGLFKDNPNLYSHHGSLQPFHFLFYSFSATLWNTIEELKANSPISQSVLMIQELLSFALVGILISLFISHQSQRASSDLDDAIRTAENEAARVESWIVAEYKINSIAAAIDHLARAEANMLKAIAWLSKGI